MPADLPDAGSPVTLEHRGGRLWVVFPDGLSVYGCLDVEAAIVAQCPAGAFEVVVDCVRVRTLYSSGLGILARMQVRLAKSGGKVYLVNVSKAIKELLSSLHLDKVFALYATDVEFEIMRDTGGPGAAPDRVSP
jgi:anti-anti-sigma factor